MVSALVTLILAGAGVSAPFELSAQDPGTKDRADGELGPRDRVRVWVSGQPWPIDGYFRSLTDDTLVVALGGDPVAAAEAGRIPRGRIVDVEVSSYRGTAAVRGFLIGAVAGFVPAFLIAYCADLYGGSSGCARNLHGGLRAGGVLGGSMGAAGLIVGATHERYAPYRKLPLREVSVESGPHGGFALSVSLRR